MKRSVSNTQNKMVEIRSCQEEDLPSIVRMEAKYYPHEAYSLEKIIEVLHKKDPLSCFLVAVQGDQIIGYAQAESHDNPEQGYFSLLTVDTAHRQQGVGRRLIEQVLAFFKEHKISKVSLTVKCHNVKAMSLYESLGFRVCKHLPKHYEKCGDGDGYEMIWKDDIKD